MEHMVSYNDHTNLHDLYRQKASKKPYYIILIFIIYYIIFWADWYEGAKPYTVRI